MALQALAAFEWEMHLESFLHEKVLPWIDNDQEEIRSAAAMALLHVAVVPKKRGRASDLVSTIVQRVLLVGVADTSTALRCKVLHTFATRSEGNFDHILKRSDPLD